MRNVKNGANEDGTCLLDENDKGIKRMEMNASPKKAASQNSVCVTVCSPLQCSVGCYCSERVYFVRKRIAMDPLFSNFKKLFISCQNVRVFRYEVHRGTLFKANLRCDLFVVRKRCDLLVVSEIVARVSIF